MAKIIIIGGHGEVARRLAPLLVDRDDEVTGVIRNADHRADVAATGARPVVADVEQMDVAGLAALLRGHDAVVWSAGAGGGNPARTYAVDRDAAMRTIDAAEAAGVARFVMVSYVGARRDHGVPEDDPFFAYAEAKAAADDHLRAAGLEYTILGPGALTFDDPTGLIDVLDPELTDDRTDVTRGDVAAVVAASLADDTTVGRTIAFRNGDRPIAEALRG